MLTIKKKSITIDTDNVSKQQEFTIETRNKEVDENFDPIEEKQRDKSKERVKPLFQSSLNDHVLCDHSEEKLLLPVATRELSQSKQQYQQQSIHKSITKTNEQRSCNLKSSFRSELNNTQPLFSRKPGKRTFNDRWHSQSFVEEKMQPSNTWKPQKVERLYFPSNQHDYNTSLYDRNPTVPSRYIPPPGYMSSASSPQVNLPQFGYVHPQDPEEYTHLEGSNIYVHHQDHFSQSQLPYYNREAIKHGIWQESLNGQLPQQSDYASDRLKPQEANLNFFEAYHKYSSVLKSQTLNQKRQRPDCNNWDFKAEFKERVRNSKSKEKSPTFRLAKEDKRNNFLHKELRTKKNQQKRVAFPMKQYSRKKQFQPTVNRRIDAKPHLRRPPLTTHSHPQFGKLGRSLRPASKNFGSNPSKCSHTQNFHSAQQRDKESSNKSSHRTVIFKKHIKGLKLGPHDPDKAVVQDVIKKKRKRKRNPRRVKRVF